MRHFSRRATLGMLLGGSASLCLPPAMASRGPEALSPEDDAFLDDLERRACLFFTEQAGAVSGQVLDRARAINPTGARDPRRVASISATGFGLAALCIADRRGYAPRPDLKEQVLRTLRFHAKQMPHNHGFLYHFSDVDTGKPIFSKEVSSIDTSLLLCGVLTARAHFASDPEIVGLATLLYERVDWPWMISDRSLPGQPVFSMGWKEPSGFLKATWSHYCELMMLPLLAMGSPTHPVDASAWTAWSRPTLTYDGLTYITGRDPLFTHQYSHAYFDFRNKRDAYADYFANSITATRAHKAFCLDLGLPYSDDYWGISASDSQAGYQAWGGPPPLGHIDGSVVPYASAGSLPFLPGPCLHVLRALRANFGDRCWSRYGFCDAFHPQTNWYDPDVLGIDLGISLLMAENLRSGFVWETFARNPEVPASMKKAGFHRNDAASSQGSHSPAPRKASHT